VAGHSVIPAIQGNTGRRSRPAPGIKQDPTSSITNVRRAGGVALVVGSEFKPPVQQQQQKT
jgi:hypothetical protein